MTFLVLTELSSKKIMLVNSDNILIIQPTNLGCYIEMGPEFIVNVSESISEILTQLDKQKSAKDDQTSQLLNYANCTFLDDWFNFGYTTLTGHQKGEAFRLAKLGAAVESMPAGNRLRHLSNGKWRYEQDLDEQPGLCSTDTVAEALGV